MSKNLEKDNMLKPKQELVKNDIQCQWPVINFTSENREKSKIIDGQRFSKNVEFFHVCYYDYIFNHI